MLAAAVAQHAGMLGLRWKREGFPLSLRERWPRKRDGKGKASHVPIANGGPASGSTPLRRHDTPSRPKALVMGKGGLPGSHPRAGSSTHGRRGGQGGHLRVLGAPAGRPPSVCGVLRTDGGQGGHLRVYGAAAEGTDSSRLHAEPVQRLRGTCRVAPLPCESLRTERMGGRRAGRRWESGKPSPFPIRTRKGGRPAHGRGGEMGRLPFSHPGDESSIMMRATPHEHDASSTMREEPP